MGQYQLFEPFRSNGTWWLPTSPEHRVPGTLEYTGDQLLLTVHGDLDQELPADFGHIDSFLRQPTHIHGTSEGRDKCTLLRTHLAVRRNAEATYGATYAIIGDHTGAYEDILLRSLRFSCTCLEEFLGMYVFGSTDENDEHDRFEKQTVVYVMPDDIALEVPSLDSELGIEFGLNTVRAQTAVSLTAHANLQVRPKGEQSFDWFFKNMWRLCSLLTLLTDETIRPKWLRLDLVEGANDVAFLYRSQIKPEKPEGLLLFQYCHFLNRLDEIVDKWFSASDVIFSSINLYRDAHQSDDPSSRWQFLMLTQALEAFSRGTTSSLYMPEGDYEAVRKSLVTAIPKIGDDHRSSLKNKIKYGNEYSMRKRITDLVASLQEATVKCFCNEPKNFIAERRGMRVAGGASSEPISGKASAGWHAVTKDRHEYRGDYCDDYSFDDSVYVIHYIA